MKVIVAGMSKTGTKSMQAALKELGYNVYDFLENYKYLSKEWEQIFLNGGNTEDFRRMFENVDAVSDIPGCYFWDEIHKAFPDAKIILTMRENEDVWVDSMMKQLEVIYFPGAVFVTYLSPTIRRIRKHGYMLLNVVYGMPPTFYHFKKPTMNKLLLRMAYRRHNSHVLQTAPSDKLLVYNVKQGWGPLCKFLEVESPKTPFPHKNAGGNIAKEWAAKEPLFIRAKQETLLSLSMIGCLLSLSIYKLATSTILSNYLPLVDFGKFAFW